MRAALAGALSLILLTPASAAAAVDCEAWAKTTGAWDEVEAMIRANYAYLDRAGDVEGLFGAARAAARSATSLAELGEVAESLGYAFRDGHFHASPVRAPARAWIPSAADLWVEVLADDAVVIVDVKQGSKAAAQGLRPGDRITALNGQPLAPQIRELLRFVEHPTPDQRSYAANVLLAGRLGTVRQLQVRDRTGDRGVDLPDGYGSVGARPDAPFSLIRHGDIGQIRFHNSLGNNANIAAIDALLDSDHQLRAIILDLRDTPSGGNTTVARAIMGHFVDTQRTYQIHRNYFEHATYGVPRESHEQLLPRGRAFTGPVVVLAGRWTGSVGEAIAMAMDRSVGAVSIGTGLADLLGTLNTTATDNGCLSIDLAWDALFAADGAPREDWIPATLLASGEIDADGNDPALAEALRRLGQPRR